MPFSKFLAAQTDAFSSAAKGAKIPDSYSFPTDTAQLEAEWLIVPSASGSFDFAILPHPLYSVYSNQVSNAIPTGGETTSTNPAAGGAVGGQVYFAPGDSHSSLGIATSALQYGPAMSGVISYDLLNKQCLSYRVVGVSAKIESLMIPTVATGTMTMCHVPLLSEAPLVIGTQALGGTSILNANAEGVATDAANLCTFMGLPTLDSSGYFDTSMRQYATGHTLNAVEFQKKGLQSNLRIVGSDSTTFRATDEVKPVFTGDSRKQYQGEVVQQLGATTAVPDTALNALVMPASFTSIGGWSSWCFRGAGFPTVGKPGAVLGTQPYQPVASLRVCILIEYIENPGFGNIAGSSANAQSGFYGSRFTMGSNEGYFKCLEIACGLPFYRPVNLYGSSSTRNSVRLGN